MPEYLSKEEVKQWRSSLEKITLEEYAARLGKKIEEEKQTNDLVDIILKSQPTMTKIDSLTQTKGEKITSIAQKAFDREKEITTSLSQSLTEKKVSAIAKKPEKTIVKSEKETKLPEKISLKEEVRFVFNKSLTDREQMVFDYFEKNQNQIVYAKDLALLLELPRDYVYKYIKNLRAKLDGDKLQNSDNGGYILTI